MWLDLFRVTRHLSSVCLHTPFFSALVSFCSSCSCLCGAASAKCTVPLCFVVCFLPFFCAVMSMLCWPVPVCLHGHCHCTMCTPLATFSFRMERQCPLAGLQRFSNFPPILFAYQSHSLPRITRALSAPNQHFAQSIHCSDKNHGLPSIFSHLSTLSDNTSAPKIFLSSSRTCYSSNTSYIDAHWPSGLRVCSRGRACLSRSLASLRPCWSCERRRACTCIHPCLGALLNMDLGQKDACFDVAGIFDLHTTRLERVLLEQHELAYVETVPQQSPRSHGSRALFLGVESRDKRPQRCSLLFFSFKLVHMQQDMEQFLGASTSVRSVPFV